MMAYDWSNYDQDIEELYHPENFEDELVNEEENE